MKNEKSITRETERAKETGSNHIRETERQIEYLVGLSDEEADADVRVE